MSDVTYTEIKDRCKLAALEYLPAMPKANFLDWWEAYEAELEDFDIYEAATEEVDSWEWTIYTHYGVKILDLLPSHVTNQAESEFFDCMGDEPISTLNDHYDLASRIAYFALLIMMQNALEELRQELIELTQAQLENMAESGELL
jgi:hypothetical protein